MGIFYGNIIVYKSKYAFICYTENEVPNLNRNAFYTKYGIENVQIDLYTAVSTDMYK